MEERQIIAEPLHINKAVSNLSDEEWEVALKRYHVIAPIINNERGVSIVAIANQK